MNITNPFLKNEDDTLPFKKPTVVEDIEFLFNEIIYSTKQNISFIQKDDAMANIYRKVFNKISLEMKRNDNFRNFLTEIAAFDIDLLIHSLNVTIYSLAIAKEIQLNEHAMYPLAISSMLHDIGKLFIPTSILYKTERLNHEEFEIVQQHTEYGFRYLSNKGPISSFTLLTALQHHERIDGSGYPNGVKNNDIHLFAKIVAVADVFDALTSERSYKDGMTAEKAISILEKDRHKLDNDILNGLINVVKVLEIGSAVTLNNNEKGVVIKQTKNPFKPIIALQNNNLDENSCNLNTLNLSENDTLFIQETEPIVGLKIKLKEHQKKNTFRHIK